MKRDQACLKFLGGWRHSFVDPFNFFMLIQSQAPTWTYGPSSHNIPIPLRIDLHQIAGCESVFFIQDDVLVSASNKPAIFGGRVRPPRFVATAPGAFRMVRFIA
jgi:hypothetical protein